MDGASNTQGGGAGIILVEPDNIEITYALRFNFKVTHNEAEYEALLVGLGLALAFGIDHLEIEGNL